jgi:DNA adenine methylase
LYHFWQWSQSDVDSLIAQIEYWRESYSVGKELHRFLINNMEGFDPLKKAAAFFSLTGLLFPGQPKVAVFLKQLMRSGLRNRA